MTFFTVLYSIAAILFSVAASGTGAEAGMCVAAGFILLYAIIRGLITSGEFSN